jgi:hypothetical protein
MTTTIIKRPHRLMLGRYFLVKLEPAQLDRAKELGDGNISAGIRRALTSDNPAPANAGAEVSRIP